MAHHEGSVPAGAPEATRVPGVPAAVPLTARILSLLPRPAWVWVVAWALVPWLNLVLVVHSGAEGWRWAGLPLVEVLNRAAVSFAVLLSLWGAARIAGELRTLGPTIADLVADGDSDVARLFPGVGGVLAPLTLTVAVGVVLPLDEALRGEPVAAVLQAGTWLVIGIPLSTAVWVYAALQIGLNRLGAGRATLKPYSGDRTLGLRPVGSLAFTGFWMLFGSVAPLVVTGFADRPTVVVGLVVLTGAAGLFFLSLRRLHRQMAAVKQRETELALDLYREAYRQVRAHPTLEVLREQAALLKAAEDLEKRAAQVQTWPFDEVTMARVVTIATSVAAVVIARLILAPAGL
jgi:hypothetical protein